MEHKYTVKVSFGWCLGMQFEFAEQNTNMFFGMKFSQLCLSC